MICNQTVHKFCCEDISLIENYDKAIEDKSQVWHCHHRDEIKVLPSGIKVIRSKEELIENGRYYNCPANELIFLLPSEHRKLHNSVYVASEETKRKIGIKNSKALKGRIPKNIDLLRNYTNKGKHWYNDGKHSILAFECPINYKEGRI